MLSPSIFSILVLLLLLGSIWVSDSLCLILLELLPESSLSRLVLLSILILKENIFSKYVVSLTSIIVLFDISSISELTTRNLLALLLVMQLTITASTIYDILSYACYLGL